MATKKEQLAVLAEALGISDDDDYDEVPDDQLVSVGELDDPPDEDEVK